MVCNFRRVRKTLEHARDLGSQSPYGAKWFATAHHLLLPGAPQEPVAIPLRGYVVCNLERNGKEVDRVAIKSQSPYGAKWLATQPRLHASQQSGRHNVVAIPLRGYVACNPMERRFGLNVKYNESQSPCGAKWFATGITEAQLKYIHRLWSQSPYGAKWFATPYNAPDGGIAYKYVSQSPYGAKWFATTVMRDLEYAPRMERVAIPLRG